MSNTVLTSPTDIERIEAPSREEFEERYVKLRKPVILTGVASKWRAFREWTPEYLKRVAGDTQVTVHYDEAGNFRDWYNKNPAKRPDRRMPFADVLDMFTADPPDRRFYMTEHGLHLISDALTEDLSMSQYIEDVPNPGSATGPCLFVGHDTCMPAHYHGTTEAFMCQLTGTKSVTLYGPEQYPYLYPRPWYSQGYVFSRIDWKTQRAMAKHDRSGYDLARWPKLADAKGLEFTVHPGEILFIPVHWWHVTAVDGYQLSITYFWMSQRARYHYPSPGIQVTAHETLRRSGLRLRNLGARLTGRKVTAPTASPYA